MRQALRAYLQDRPFRTAMIAIALPIILQTLLSNSLSFVDTLMIGRLGETEVAAVGLANQMFFLIFLIFFGITSGTGIFIAQFWGDRDHEGIKRVIGLSLTASLLFALPFTLVSFLLPESLMRIFSPDPDVVAVGAEYLRVVAPSYLFSAVAFCFGMALRSIERTRIPLIATAISLSVNSVLNLVLIFGLAEFPAMGVRGAALATMIGRGLELIILVSLVYAKNMPIAGSLREYLAFKAPLVKRFLRTATPVLMNEVAWSLGMVMYKIVFSRMGTGVIAAANVTESIQGLFFVVLIGTGNTAAVMIGKKIGEGDQDGARRYGSYFLIQGLILGLGLAALMAAMAPLAVLPFRMSAEVITLTRTTLLTLAIVIPVKSMNLHLIVGILRSGGDTTFSFLTELAGVWLIGVPLAFLAGLLLNFTLPWVYLIVGIEELFKLVMTLRRFQSGKWINDLTREKSDVILISPDGVPSP